MNYEEIIYFMSFYIPTLIAAHYIGKTFGLNNSLAVGVLVIGMVAFGYWMRWVQTKE